MNKIISIMLLAATINCWGMEQKLTKRFTPEEGRRMLKRMQMEKAPFGKKTLFRKEAPLSPVSKEWPKMKTMREGEVKTLFRKEVPLSPVSKEWPKMKTMQEGEVKTLFRKPGTQKPGQKRGFGRARVIKKGRFARGREDQ